MDSAWPNYPGAVPRWCLTTARPSMIESLWRHFRGCASWHIRLTRVKSSCWPPPRWLCLQTSSDQAQLRRNDMMPRASPRELERWPSPLGLRELSMRGTLEYDRVADLCDQIISSLSICSKHPFLDGGLKNKLLLINCLLKRFTLQIVCWTFNYLPEANELSGMFFVFGIYYI